MKKVKLYFPREMIYGKRVFEGGKVHEISEEVPGFIDRWIKRGCTIAIKEEKPTRRPRNSRQEEKPIAKPEEKEENKEKLSE